MKKLAIVTALALTLPLLLGTAQAQHHGGSFHGGSFHGGFHGGGFRGGIFFGGPYFDPFWGPFYPYAYDPYYDYGDYPYPPPSGSTAMAPVQSWYYCGDPKGYYPYVQSCKGPWQAVPASPPPPPPSGPPAPMQQG